MTSQSIFADKTYAKPFFLTYFNTTCFILALVPVLIRSGFQRYKAGKRVLPSGAEVKRHRRDRISGTVDESQAFLEPEEHEFLQHETVSEPKRKHLGIVPTARLAFMFCILWFCANYFAMACLQYTTVASTTILTSTSSIWTLLIGAFTGTERFTWRKLLGVLASFMGILLVSRADLSAKSPGSTGALLPRNGTPGITNPFPPKSASELALGDTLAFLSAVIYGAYTITLKRTTLRCRPLELNMPLFFGLVGLCNFVLLFPLFPVLHYTGLERFQLPPTQRIWTILLVNSLFSLLSDICWAYAMVLTSPLIVTVGLSLTIPLSLVGEMILQGKTETWVYWVGACIVVFSFVFVDREEVKDEEAGIEQEALLPVDTAVEPLESPDNSDVVVDPPR